MAISRRELMRRAAILGVTSAGLAACSDDDGAKKATPDAGGDTSGDTTADAPTDTGADGSGASDVAPDVDWTDDFDDYAWEGELGPETLFQHGVASGDPLSDAVILWTRVSPASEGPVAVRWEMSENLAFDKRVAVDTFTTNADRDYTVKVDVSGLEAGRTYYFRFFAQGRMSTIGRTRTAPTGDVRRLRFGVVSCASFPHGYYHVYRSLANRADLDAILHLGDYIYEYGEGQYGGVRPSEPTHEIVTLADYRTRYAQYRRDANLQAVHQQHPMIAVWDDHESANNSFNDGAQNHNPETEGPWEVRKAAAVRAYSEWMPIRSGTDAKIWRKLAYGDLVDLIMLDTRLWGRDEELPASAGFADRTRADRSILGDDQETWFHEQLRTSTAKWKVIGQQVMIGHWKAVGQPDSAGGGTYLNLDGWDGYQSSRDRFFKVIRDHELDNIVVLTGDVHSSWAFDLTQDPNDPAIYTAETGEGALAVEYVTPAVTSPGLGGSPQQTATLLRSLLRQNPHLKFADASRRGYIILDITPERAQAAWFLFDRIDREEVAPENLVATFATYDGQNRLREEPDAAAPPSDPPTPAPEPER